MDTVKQDAIEWLVLMRSGEATPQDVAAFEAWRKLDPRHEATCQRIEKSLSAFALVGADSTAASHALNTRRRAVKALFSTGAILVIGAGAIFRDRLLSSQPVVLASYAAPVGKRREQHLPDGTSMVFNANTVASRTEDGLRLQRGEVYVDRTSQAPLAVFSDLCKVVCHAAKFAVRHDAGRARIAVLEGDVTLFTKNNGTQRVSARQVALVTAAGVEITSRLNASAEVAWLDGLLQVSDRPLRDVVAALRDYRQGELVLDERIADRRLSGVFSLDDTDKALRAIARTLDVRVRIVSDHITRIEPRLS